MTEEAPRYDRVTLRAKRPTAAQEKRARIAMMEATDVFRRLGFTRQQVEAMAGSMYDFNRKWEPW